MTAQRARDLERVSELRVQEIAELDYVKATGELWRIRFRIQRELRKPSDFFGMHWREKNRERKAWQARLTNALVASYGMRRAQDLLTAKSGLVDAIGVRPSAKRRVTIARLTPSPRFFMHDDDNLHFSCKPLLDAVKQLGLIRDDQREWLERIGPSQVVSPDGTFWTHLTIEPCEVLP